MAQQRAERGRGGAAAIAGCGGVPRRHRGMLDEVDRLPRLVESLLAVTRAESGRIPLTRDLVDLGELAASVADNFRVLAEEKEQSLRIDTGLASARGATLRWFAWARSICCTTRSSTRPARARSGWGGCDAVRRGGDRGEGERTGPPCRASRANLRAPLRGWAPRTPATAVWSRCR
jgi:hypothetical protein